MYYISIDDHSNFQNSRLSVRNICLNIIKRIFRSKLIIVLIIIFFTLLIYINTSAILSNQANLKAPQNIPIDELSNNNLKDIENRIGKLENSLDNLNKNAKVLKNEIKNHNSISQKRHFSKNKVIESLQEKKNDLNIDKTVVLVMACNRPESVENHLRQLIEKRASSNLNSNNFPIIVSQDCGHQETTNSINKFSSDLYAIIKQPDQTDITQSKTGPIAQHMRGYFKISRHYKWALDQVFVKFNFSSVIITEDDLNIAVDFFDYFKSMLSVLEQDKSLYCVSAWNDNGKQSLIDSSRSELVHRSDFFPGLGWMMLRSLWIDELRAKWPQAFWDDWLREPKQRKDRSCLRPEISRTDMAIQYAKKGVSMGQFFDNYLKLIIINKNPVDWSKIDTTTLRKEKFDPKYIADVYDNSVEMPFVDYLKISNTTDSKNKKSILMVYNSKQEFLKFAKYFGIMNDFKSGVPRTGYLGVVRIFFKSRVIYIAPKQKKNWSRYDQSYKGMIEVSVENEINSKGDICKLKDGKEKVNDKNKLRLNYFCLCFYAFMTGTDFAVIIPTLWDRLNFDYSASGTFMGLVISSYSFSGVVSGLVMGKISDKCKKNKIFMLFSILFAVIGHILYFFGINKYFVLLARTLSGISIGASTVALAFIARTTSEKKRTAILSIVMASRQFGLMFGPAFNIVLRQVNFYLFGKFLVDRKSIPGLFMAFTWTLYFFIFFFLFQELNLNQERTDDEQMENNSKFHSRKSQFWRAEIFLLLAMTFFTYFNQTSLETMVIPFTEIMFDWNELENSILFCCGGVIIIISFVIIRILSKKFKDRVILLIGLLSIIIGLSIACIFLPFVDKFDKDFQSKNQSLNKTNSTVDAIKAHQNSDGVFFGAFVVFVIFDVIGLPAIAITSSSLFTKMIDNKYQGFGQGIQRGILGIGTIIGPLCAGPLIYKPIILVSIILFIISLIFFMFLFFFKRFKPIEDYSFKNSSETDLKSN